MNEGLIVGHQDRFYIKYMKIESLHVLNEIDWTAGRYN